MQDDTQHRVPSPSPLRHLALLIAQASGPKATSGLRTIPPTPPPSAESPTGKERPLRGALSPPSACPGDTEGRSFCGAPLPRASYCSAALGSVGGILRSGRGPSAQRCGGSGFRSLRRAPAALVSSPPDSCRQSDERNPQPMTPATSTLPGQVPCT